MPSWIKGKDGELGWEKAKSIVKKEYGSGIEKSDPEKFYSLVTTIYKNVCKSPDYECGIVKKTESENVTMRSLIEKKMGKTDVEQTADRIVGELKKAGIRATSGMDEVYISSGDDEVSMTFNPNTGKASVRMVLYREVDANGKAIKKAIKDHGVKV